MESTLYREPFVKGMEKGKADTLANIAIRLLTKKLGYLPDDIEAKIRKLNASTLEIIADSIFEINSIEGINKYLPRH